MRAFALVDCNNFYVSCERVFNPKLEGRIVVILSNNDGNVISRSPEAKAAGIPMGAPWHEVRPELERVSGLALSSNYVLYGDMSARVRMIFDELAPSVEVYSIDECFLDLGNIAGLDLEAHGREIGQRVRQWTGIPVGVGIGPTKTLAKAANRLAKKNGGVFSLFEKAAIRAALAGMDARDVWGVGSRWSKKLEERGIHSALALADADPRFIRKGFSVVLQRTCYELQGISCIALEKAPPPKKQIIVSRAFGKKVTTQQDLKEGVSYYMTRAAEKLRSGRLAARTLSVFAHTNHFSKKDHQYSSATSVSLEVPTDNTGELIHHALEAIERVYKPGYRYHKAGVMLLDLSPAESTQTELFATDSCWQPELMQGIDTINGQMGRGTIRYGSEGFRTTWRRKSNHCSPRYTTRWDEIPKAGN